MNDKKAIAKAAWYQLHKNDPHLKARVRRARLKYNLAHPEVDRLWRNRNKHHIAKKRLEYCNKIKTQVLTHYGKNGQMKCCWPDCEVTDIDVLSLDHIEPLLRTAGGKRHPDNDTGINFYRRCIKSGFPSGLQTLCMNHQIKKEILRKRSVWMT